MLRSISVQNIYISILMKLRMGLTEIGNHVLLIDINMLKAYLLDWLNVLFFTFMGTDFI
jgi:hypothetical protein